jgi:preprotein translocase subunit YajC
MPQKKRQQEKQKMLEAMQKGDEVVTTGGILGTITGVTDKVVTLEIAPKVRIRVAKAHVTEVTNKSSESGATDKK